VKTPRQQLTSMNSS